MNHQEIAKTPRLRLRTLVETDANFYLSLVNDPSFINNIRDKGLRTEEQARHAIVQTHIEVHQQNGFSLYLIERIDDQIAIGLCGLVRRESLPGIDLGYALLPAFVGQGYAQEACLAVIADARHRLQLKRLLAITSPNNASSEKLLVKLGFKFEKSIVSDDGDAVNLSSLNL